MGGGADARGRGEQSPGHLWEPEEPPSWGPDMAVLSGGREHTCPLRRGQRATQAHSRRGGEMRAGSATLGLGQSLRTTLQSGQCESHRRAAEPELSSASHGRDPVPRVHWHAAPTTGPQRPLLAMTQAP